jgi:hypothetical protein
MRTLFVLFAIAALPAVAFAGSPASGPGRTAPPKDIPYVIPLNSQPQSSGEDIATAYPVPELPFVDSGNSCDYVDDYDEFCPIGGSISPDVVYAYEATYDVNVDITLCDSGYDTKVYVYENEWPNLHACNDDACGTDGFRSEIVSVPFTVGNTYYVVVDGYGGYCGDYLLEIDVPIHEILECPQGALFEGEPDCYDGYDDQYNSGCSAMPEPMFSPLYGTPDGAHYDVCGTSGTFLVEGMNFRDGDWYEFHVTEPNTITFECRAEFPVLILLFDASGGCWNPLVLADAYAGAFPDLASITYGCDPGVYRLWVGPSVFTGVPCGALYVLGIDGLTLEPIALEPTTWSSIKGRHR